MTQARRTGPALESMYRFLLGDRIQTTALDVLERLIEATYTRARRNTLAEANLGIEKLRFLFRLAKDLHHVNVTRYEHAARSLDAIDRLTREESSSSHRLYGAGQDFSQVSNNPHVEDRSTRVTVTIAFPLFRPIDQK